MNSEELELSLRNEFESYLKSILADMKQEVSDFQTKFQTEFEKHKLQLDDVFKDFSARIEGDRQLDAAFKDSVVEHLRLSRDEGARITASAIAEAEELEKENAASVPVVGFSEIRDAISDISGQDSQSAILKSLVNHAAQFTARGAFFIIKNEHFVGWRVFGQEAEMDEQAMREIFFPMANETLLSESVRSLSAVESSFGTYDDDSLYLNKLDFGQPEKMFAIPLIARGRGVAVLYADYGTRGANVNIEALETLVRVAGLTVELLAAAQVPKPAKEESYAADRVEEISEISAPNVNQTYQAVNGYEYSESPEVVHAAAEEYVEKDNFQQVAYAAFEEPQTETAPETFEYQSKAYEAEESQPRFGEDKEESYFTPNKEAKDYEFVSDQQPVIVDEERSEEKSAPVFSWNQPVESFEQTNEPIAALENEKAFVSNEDADEKAEEIAAVPASEYVFESTQPYSSGVSNFEESAPVAETPEISQWDSGGYQEPVYDNSRFETPQTVAEPQFESFEQSNDNFAAVAAAPVETVSETIGAASTTKSRFSDRNVDLPIEVAEDERRSHNDARRFARLLVSEIKLYNEQKVKEGRDGRDLYDRLREAIDRSREMYDKRVQPPVASKFDYFHYELVSNLAEGDSAKLGASYPGATI